MVGIYKIEHKKTHKVYIGQSIDVQRRLSAHRSRSTSDQQIDIVIQQEGVDQFSFEVLEECSVEKLNEREQYYIELYNSYLAGYNQTKGGKGTSGACVKLSETDVVDIYELLLNTTLPQSEIAAMYQVGQDTISEINHGKTRRLGGYSFPLRKRSTEKATVLKDTPVSQILTPEVLLEDFRQLKSFAAIGRKYNVSHTQIRRIAAKYGWTAEDLKQLCAPVKPVVRPVLQFSKDGQFIREFASTAEASRLMGDWHVKQVCDGKRKTSQGFIYKYK